jgi:hypothetical protein
MPPEREYEVGYGKPPEHTRFQKGQSGNPRGRPKKCSKNFATAFSETLNETVSITENGRRRKITKLEALAKQVINGAVKGEPNATQTLLRLMGYIDRQRKMNPQQPIIRRFGADAKL